MCENNSNVLHVDAYFLKNGEQKLSFQEYPAISMGP